LISFVTRSAIILSRSDSTSAPRNADDSPIGISQTSAMCFSFTVTANDAGLSRAPPQCGHGTSRMYDSTCSRLQSDSASEWRRFRNGMTPS